MATPSIKSSQSLAALVYVVDDSADYHRLVETIFNRYLPGYYFRLFDNGQACLDALLQLDEKPNLIILDQHMPHLSGYQTLMALKQQPQYHSVPVVMMSADASHSEISSFYEAGAATFLPKPTDFSALKKMLLAACQYANRPRGVLK